MTHRAVTLLAGIALMLVALPAQAQADSNPYDRFTDWLDKTWNEAGDSGLKFEKNPIDMAQFRVVTPTPWTTSDSTKQERYRNVEPPAVDGIAYGNDRLQNWLDWYDLQLDEAVQAKDRDREIEAWQEKVFLTYSRTRKFTDYGPSNYRYQGELRGYIGVLAPAPDLSGYDFRQLLTMKQEEADRLLREAYDATPKERLAAFENALRHYLSIIANEEIEGPPLEGDALQDSGANHVKMLAELLEYQGRVTEARPVRAASDAHEYNSKVDGYNWLVNYRYQNLQVGNFSVAAEWSRNMIERLSAMVPIDDPRVLRVILLSAADHFAANDITRGQEIIKGAGFVCEKTADCTALAAQAGALEGFAMLEAMGEKAQASAYKAAVAGRGDAGNPALAALERVTQLEKEREDCFGQIELDPTSPFVLTPAARTIVAQCNVAIGPDIFAAYEAAGNDFDRSEAMRGLAEDIANGALQIGEFALAEPYFRQLVTAARTAGQPYSDDLALMHAMTLIATGQLDEADRVLAETRTSGEQFMLDGLSNPTDFSRRIDGVKALTISRYLADPAKAHLAFEAAKERAEDHRSFRQSQVGSVRNETNLARIIGWNERFLEAADASWALAIRETTRRSEARDVAFAAVQDALTDRTSLSLSYAMADKADFSSDPQTTGLIARRRELLDMLAPYEGVAAKDRSFGLPGSTREEIERRREFELVEELSAEYRAINHQLAQAAPDYFKLIRPEPLSLDDARAVLRDDEAVMMLIPSAGGTHSMVLTSEGVEWHRSEMTVGEIDAAVRRLLWFSGANVELDGREQRQWEGEVDGGRNGFDRDTAYRLYSELLKPLESSFAGKRHLFVAAGGSLGSLPLGVLVTGEPEGRDDDPAALRQTPWLARDANLVRIPSLQTLAYQRRFTSAVDGPDEFRGFGDPVLDGEAQARSRGHRSGTGLTAASVLRRDSEESGIANVAKLRTLARLPGTEVELTAMARAFGAERSALYLGAEATESRFKESDLSAVSVLALATHGLTAGEADGSGEPGLVFSPPEVGNSYDDGYLTASEVAQMRIGADWVILSACNTAAGDGSAGAPGLSGLARAFFYAGASNLLASHWPVRDDVAARLTVRTIELARDDHTMSRAEALTAAMREIREDGSADGKLVEGYDLTFSHPSAWAAFELIGDAGVR